MDEAARPHWRGFRGRLLFTHLAVALTVLAGVEIALDLAIREHLSRQLHVELAHEAALVGEAVAGVSDEPTAMDALADRMGAALESRVTVIEPDGFLSGDSEVPLSELPVVENHAERPEVIEAVASGTGTSVRWSTTVRKRMVYVARRADAGRVVRVSRSTEQVDAAARSARYAVLGTGLVAALLSAILAATVSGALARPIRAVTGVAREMASGNLGRRIVLRRGDELGELAEALNDLAASFARTIEEVTEERNRLAAVLAGMVEGVLVVDATGRVVLMNPSLREILGIQQDVSGSTVLEAVRSPDLHSAVSAVLAGGAPLTAGVLRSGRLSVDLERHRAEVDDREVTLTALEFRLLACLLERVGRVQTRDVLLTDVWGLNSEVETRTVDAHVKRLRRKLGAAGDAVETVRGVGYRLRESDQP